MAHVRADRVMEASTTTGTGNFTVSGAVAGFATLASRLTVSDTFDYAIFAVDGDGTPTGAWETGIGTYTAANEFSRSVRQSSNSDALVNFAAGDKRVVATLTAAASAKAAAECITIACSDETTALTTGTAKVTFRMPYAFALLAVRASVTTAPTGSLLTVDINEGGSSILSTKLTIDATEKTSTTAAAAAVISDAALADDAEITIDIDTIGSTFAGAGLKVYLIGERR